MKSNNEDLYICEIKSKINNITKHVYSLTDDYSFI